ncbi:AfsR/SARP family transcriptional regulator [Streptomyces phaeolivaceus]|nr:AfsR/SARP family transcriptional regulator [Streptomyces phaeolivaceus]
MTSPGGYTLRVDPGELDLHVFETKTGHARALMATGDYESAAARFDSAFALWRAPFIFYTGSPSLDELHGPRLEDTAISAVEDHAETLLALGRWLPLTTRLRPLVERFPFRERLLGQYMLALHWSGRRVEALDVFQRLRSSLVSELGIEPSRELSALRQRIVCDDTDLAPPDVPLPALAMAGPAQPRRRVRTRQAGQGLQGALERQR